MIKTSRWCFHLVLCSLVAVPASLFAGTTFSAKHLAADGVVADSLECTLTSGGLMPLISIVAALATHKSALGKCLGGHESVGVQWSAPAGTITSLRTTSGPGAAQKCVQQALQSASGFPAGTCSAVLSVE